MPPSVKTDWKTLPCTLIKILAPLLFFCTLSHILTRGNAMRRSILQPANYHWCGRRSWFEQNLGTGPPRTHRITAYANVITCYCIRRTRANAVGSVLAPNRLRVLAMGAARSVQGADGLAISTASCYITRDWLFDCRAIDFTGLDNIQYMLICM